MVFLAFLSKARKGKSGILLVLQGIFGGLLEITSEIQAREKNTKINFLGPETTRWRGGLPREGVVAEKFVPSLESLSSLGFEERNLGCPEILPGFPGLLGVFKKFVRKKFVRIFRSLVSLTRQPFANPSANSKLLFPWAPGTRSETRIIGFLGKLMGATQSINLFGVPPFRKGTPR